MFPSVLLSPTCGSCLHTAGARCKQTQEESAGARGTLVSLRAPTTVKMGSGAMLERPLKGEELLRSIGISIQLHQGSGTRVEHEAGVSASGNHAARLPSLERMAPTGTHVCQEPF